LVVKPIKINKRVVLYKTMEKKPIQDNPESPDTEENLLENMGINEDGKPIKKEEPDKEPEVKPEEVEVKPKEPETSEPKPLPPAYIPIPKYTDEKKAWQKKEEELSTSLSAKDSKIAELEAEVQRAKTPQDFKNRISKFASKYNLNVDAMTELGTEILSEVNKGQESISQRLNAYDEQAKSFQQNSMFEEEFKTYVKDYPEMKDHKTKVKELALGDKWEDWKGKSVFEVYFRGVKPNITEPRKSAEPSKGGTKRGGVKDLDAMSPEEALKLPSKDFEKWSNRQAKKQGLGLSKSDN